MRKLDATFASPAISGTGQLVSSWKVYSWRVAHLCLEEIAIDPDTLSGRIARQETGHDGTVSIQTCSDIGSRHANLAWCATRFARSVGEGCSLLWYD